MKKKVLLVAALIILASFVFLTNTAAQNEEKISKAYSCLNSRVNETTLSLEEAVFSALAGVGTSKANTTINSQKSSQDCWPSSGCKIKETAQVILAKNKMQQNTTKAEMWLESQSGLSTDLTWFLQITIEGNIPANCEIRYNAAEPGFKIEIDNEMKIKQGDAGSCLTKTPSGYWLLISPNCLSNSFDISCDATFKTNLLYQKSSGRTIYVSATTNSGSTNSWTKEKVAALCFKQGNSCDYEAGLWATTALYATQTDLNADDKNDYNDYVPYLKALAEDYPTFFPSAFLMHLVGRGRNDEYYNSIINNFKTDPNGGYWTVYNSPAVSYYNTALALLAFGGASRSETQVQGALQYLFKQQTTRGCWNNNNIRDTAFIIYAADWSRAGILSACGNGEIEEGEQCEPSIMEAKSCSSLNLGSGQVTCYAKGSENECQYNTTACSESNGEPPIIGTQNCSDVVGVCRVSCNTNETEFNGICTESNICCGPRNETSETSLTSCEVANHHCVADEYSCLEAGGEILSSDLYGCENNWRVCCTVKIAELPNCASKNGRVCAADERCNLATVEASDGACCLGACEEITVTQPECQTDADCGLTEECQNEKCVTKTPLTQETSYLWIWITVLTVLIILVVLGIVYRNKLRMWLFKRKAKSKEMPRGWPPVGGGMSSPMMRRAPPRFPPGRPGMMPARRPLARVSSPPPRTKQMSEKDKEMEDTLKKLREMSK